LRAWALATARMFALPMAHPMVPGPPCVSHLASTVATASTSAVAVAVRVVSKESVAVLLSHANALVSTTAHMASKLFTFTFTCTVTAQLFDSGPQRDHGCLCDYPYNIRSRACITRGGGALRAATASLATIEAFAREVAVQAEKLLAICNMG